MPPRLTAVTWLILAGAFYIGFASGSGRLWDYDLWWHLKTGQVIVQQGAVPKADPFSWTRPGAPWIAHEWGWEVVLYLAYSAGGWLGLIYLKAVLFGICAALAAWLAVRWGAGLLPALAVTALMSVAVSIWLNARPQMLIVLYVLLVLHLLTSYQQGRRRALWWLPPLFLLWANTHGSFLLGWALLALFGVCEVLQPSPRGAGVSPACEAAANGGADLRETWPRPQPRALLPLLVPGLLSVLICLANPNFLPGALYPFSYVLGENRLHAQVITEYASPDFHDPIFLTLGALMLLAFLSLILSPTTPSLWELALLFAGTILFLRWGRNGPLLAVFCVPLAARHLSERLRRSRLAWLGDATVAEHRLPRAVTLAGATLLALALVMMAPKDPAPDKTIADNLLPVQATQFVREHRLQGNLLNTYEWGGYLIWHLWPEYRVYIDGRADMYGADLLKEFEKVYKLKPEWREILAHRQIEWLVLRAKSPLAVVLAGEGEYAPAYEDNTAVILVRRGGVNQWLLEKAPAPALNSRTRRP